MADGKVRGSDTETVVKEFELICSDCGESFTLTEDEAREMDLLDTDGTIIEAQDLLCESCADADMRDVTRDWYR